MAEFDQWWKQAKDVYIEGTIFVTWFKILTHPRVGTYLF